jgi:hypothetical protein
MIKAGQPFAWKKAQTLMHPFEHWPRTGRRRALLLVIAVAIAMQILLALLDGPLRESGDGTVDFEVAGSAERAGQIVDNWRAHDLLANAAFIDGVDFLFALLYTAAIAGGCVAAAGAWRSRGRRRLAAVGIVLAWAASAAAAFDWAENVALAGSLLDAPTSPWPAIALGAAIPKFAGAWAGLLYALSGGAVALAGRMRHRGG